MTGLVAGTSQRIEVITGVARRRGWSVEEKLRIVAESFADRALSRTALPGPNAYARLRAVSRSLADIVLTRAAAPCRRDRQIAR
jgi:hypothetical protein